MKISKSVLIRFRLFQLMINTVILIAVFSFALLLDRLFECVIILLSYFSLRYKFDKTFHCANMWVCVALSILMCWVMIAVTLPVSVSILSSVMVALIDCYALYKIRDYFDMRNTIIEINKPKPFNVDTCTESELLERCKSLNYNSLKTQMAVKFFIDKEKPREVWLWLCETQDNPMDWDSVKQTKWRMKKELTD